MDLNDDAGAPAPADPSPGEAPNDDAPVRGEVRLAGWSRISHGLFRKPKEGLDDYDQFVRTLEAWLLVLPEGACFTHITGARLYNWQLPKLPEQVPVFAAVEDGDNRPRRPGLDCARLRRTAKSSTAEAASKTSKPRQRHGLPVEEPEEILLRAARDLGTLDLVILIDSARRQGDIDEGRLGQVLASRRPGVRALRRAWELSDGGAHSAGESLLRLFHRAIDVPVVAQAELRDDEGQLLAQVDLLVEGTNLVHEYDGAVHRDGAQHTTDLRRERGLGGTAYSRRGFTLDDLLNHSLVVMHEIDRSLNRPHQLARIRRWRAMVRESLYDEIGRQRVMNRWKRTMGATDWPGTA